MTARESTAVRHGVPRASVTRSVTRSMTPWLVAALALLAVAIVLSLCLGARSIPLSTVWDALFHFNPAIPEQGIIRESRLLRTVIGILAGAALALAGALTQTITRNPLADPGLLGINAGSALAIVVGITVFGVTGFAPQLWLSFLGAGTCRRRGVCHRRARGGYVVPGTARARRRGAHRGAWIHHHRAACS